MSALTQADLDKLAKAIVGGKTEVEYESGGERRKVKYASVNAMREALTFGRQLLAEQQGLPGRSMTSLAEFSRD